MSVDKEKALEQAFAMIEKTHGKGSIMKLGSADVANVEVIPSGILPLDIALGIGGFPRGRIIEIFGPEGSGKTTVALHAVSETQKLGGTVAFIDTEHALDLSYAQALGVDAKNLLISQPDYGEQALEIAEILVRSQAVDLVVIDTVAALVPKAELEGDFGDSFMGLQARLMSQSLRRLVGSINKSRTCVIFLNQLREKISTGFQAGPHETTPGGRALKFYASQRVDIRKIDVVKQGTDTIGSVVKVRIVKNKLSPPFKQAEFELIYGKGVSKTASLIDLGVQAGVVSKSGSWFYWGDLRLGQGKENAKLYLEEHPEAFAELEKIIKDTFFNLKSKTVTAKNKESTAEI
ncbi:MAG: Protein RecA [candidate division WS2 bacterium]|nr:Protein RecA [Candidatus Psychracetigena formicireducens]